MGARAGPALGTVVAGVIEEVVTVVSDAEARTIVGMAHGHDRVVNDRPADFAHPEVPPVLTGGVVGDGGEGDQLAGIEPLANERGASLDPAATVAGGVLRDRGVHERV